VAWCVWPLAVIAQIVIHALTLAPGITKADSGDVATAVTELGVMHPTGYPLYTMLAHAFTRLPLAAEPVVEIEIFNTLISAVTTVFVALTVRSLVLRSRSPHDGPSRSLVWSAELAGILAGAMLALSPTLWKQVRVPEVYPFHILLVVWSIYAWVTFDASRKRKHLLHAAIPMGLGLAHHVTIVYLFAAAFFYLLVAERRMATEWIIAPARWAFFRLRHLRRSPRPTSPPALPNRWLVPLFVLVAAVPLLSYLYLWWAAEHTSALAWGGTDDWNALWRHASGKQYRGYMKGFANDDLTKRLLGLPDRIDSQFSIVSYLPAAAGCVLLFRRGRALLLGLSVYACLNAWHGVQYRVADFGVYYLPIYSVYAIVMGVGIGRLAHAARGGARSGARRYGAVLGLVALLMAGALAYYELRRPQRLPTWLLSADAIEQAQILLLGFAAAAVTLPVCIHLVHRQQLRLPGLAAAAIFTYGLAHAPLITKRRGDILSANKSAVPYADAVVSTVPDGSVVMTGGDSYSFPLWYYQHVLDQGSGFAVINVHMLGHRWYRKKYLRPHHPWKCDPLAPDYDQSRCSDYADRLNEYLGDSWLKIDERSYRGDVKPRRRSTHSTIIDGGDPACSDAVYRAQHQLDCLCWDVNEMSRDWDHRCVRSHEDGGIVRLRNREIRAHRLVENHIDERPIYERNVYTKKSKGHKNKRGWDGPTYRRISGTYALVNRGTVNQIVYASDLDEHTACRDQLEPIALRKHERARKGTRLRKSTPYKPNPNPTLLKQAVISTAFDDKHGNPSRVLPLGADVWLHLSWFERYQYDREQTDRRGAAIRHGIRVCMYAPNGRRVLVKTLVSGGVESRIEMPADARTEPGSYTVQACTIGDVANDRAAARKHRLVRPRRRCSRTILEFDFQLRQPPEILSSILRQGLAEDPPPNALADGDGLAQAE
jgi:hypothetical protein